MVKKLPKYGQKMPKPLFEASTSFFQLFVLIFLIKDIERHYNISFETIDHFEAPQYQKNNQISTKKWLKTTKNLICAF